jgi:mRNA interferase RelE/StbE
VTADIKESDPYDLVLVPGASRALAEGLPPTAAFAAWEFITGPLFRRPRVVGAPLRAPFEGLWRARRGDYRVRYRIDDENRRIVVVDIEHRRDAYRS